MVLKLRERLCGEGQSARLALDTLVEHLATMAERKELEPNQDYVYQPRSEQVALRLNSCLAAYGQYHRQTQLTEELLGKDAYKRQMKESMEKGGYVLETNKGVKFGQNGTKRSVVLSVDKLEHAGLDPKGFMLYKDYEDIAEEK